MTTPKLIDLSFLETFTKGDLNKLKKFINMYLKSTPLVIEELFSDLRNENYESLQLKAHSIKPQAQYMGISALKECLSQIETIIETGNDFDLLGPLLDKTRKLNTQAMFELNQFLIQDEQANGYST